MRTITKVLSVAALLLAPSVASAASMPVSEAQYDACWAKADLHVSLARSAGYELPTDLAGIWVDTMAQCLAEAGFSTAKGEAESLRCSVQLDLVGDHSAAAYELCESEREERLAERAP